MYVNTSSSLGQGIFGEHMGKFGRLLSELSRFISAFASEASHWVAWHKLKKEGKERIIEREKKEGERREGNECQDYNFMFCLSL